MPTAIGGIARLAYARAKAAGLALEPLLEEAGLTPRQIEDDRARLKTRNQITFLNLAADALGDDVLGFHLAQVTDLRTIGLLYYVVASSDSVIEGLQRGARYCGIANEAFSQKCIDGDDIG